MKEISEITSQKKGDRLNVFIDGEFAFGVEYQTAVKFGLKIGRCLSQKEIDDIQLEEGNVAAFNRALKYAVKKTVSEKQMREYLKKHGYNDIAIDIAKVLGRTRLVEKYYDILSENHSTAVKFGEDLIK